jgi:hypothetical protein
MKTQFAVCLLHNLQSQIRKKPIKQILDRQKRMKQTRLWKCTTVSNGWSRLRVCWFQNTLHCSDRAFALSQWRAYRDIENAHENSCCSETTVCIKKSSWKPKIACYIWKPSSNGLCLLAQGGIGGCWILGLIEQRRRVFEGSFDSHDFQNVGIEKKHRVWMACPLQSYRIKKLQDFGYTSIWLHRKTKEILKGCWSEGNFSSKTWYKWLLGRNSKGLESYESNNVFRKMSYRSKSYTIPLNQTSPEPSGWILRLRLFLYYFVVCILHCCRNMLEK